MKIYNSSRSTNSCATTSLRFGRFGGAMLCAISLSALATSCDTTEDGYHVGTVSDVYLNTEPAVQLQVPADGKPRDIQVLSNVDWEIEKLEGIFSATADDRHGDGTITVTAGLNINDQARSSSLHIYARDFDKSLNVELIQARMRFSMDTKNYPEAPEQGATCQLTFGSSIDWLFDVSEGEASWLDFDPGISGGGEWNDITVNATWKPNYTTSPRSITLQLQPDDEDLLAYVSLPQRFTLTQAAGTLPTGVALRTTGESTYTSIPLSISYESKAPVDEIGVIIAGSGQRFVAPLQGGATYPQSGAYNFTVDGLNEKTLYTFTPFVRSKVGEVTGSQIQVRTDGDISFEGPKLASYTVEPSENSVAASFEINSDVQIKTVTVQLLNAANAVVAEQSDNVNANNATVTWHQSVTLVQNTDYTFVVKAEITNPNTNNSETVNLASLPFKTSYQTPQPGDNTPIN